MESRPETTQMSETVDTSVEDWELLAQVAQAYRSLSDSFMDRIGMHRAQATLLCRLFAHDGMTQTEIAEQLSYSEKTVKNYLSVIFQKLHLRDRTQVAIFALRQGLLLTD